MFVVTERVADRLATIRSRRSVARIGVNVIGKRARAELCNEKQMKVQSSEQRYRQQEGKEWSN